MWVRLLRVYGRCRFLRFRFEAVFCFFFCFGGIFNQVSKRYLLLKIQTGLCSWIIM